MVIFLFLLFSLLQNSDILMFSEQVAAETKH